MCSDLDKFDLVDPDDRTPEEIAEEELLEQEEENRNDFYDEVDCEYWRDWPEV